MWNFPWQPGFGGWANGWFGSLFRGTTYYVAAGASGSGLSATDPMDEADIDALSLVAGDTVRFKCGDTFALNHDLTEFGTAGRPITYTSYGIGVKPKFSALNTFAPTWTQYGATAIYQATQDATMLAFWRGLINVVLDDGVRINAVGWNTNIATTSALMYAGSYTIDKDNDIIYVWLSDGSDPTSSTIQYPKFQGWFTANVEGTKIFGNQENARDIVIDGLEFNYANHYAVQVGASEEATAAISGIEVRNCDFKYCGKGAILLTGDNAKAIRNDIYDCGGSEVRTGLAGANDDTGSIHIGCGAGSNVFEIAYNTIDIGRFGTHIEAGSVNGWVHHNYCTNGCHGSIEAGGNGTIVENNFCDDSSIPYTPTTLSRYGIISSGSTNVIVRNNIIIRGEEATAVLQIGTGSTGGVFYNNTFIRKTGAKSASTAGVLTLTDGGNPATNITIKNNIFINEDNTIDTMVKVEAGTGLDFNYNLYYTTAAAFRYRWHYGNATGFANYKTASSMEANSVETNPSLDEDYKPTAGAIDAGLTIASVTTDYAGTTRPQGAGYDIGAYEVA